MWWRPMRPICCGHFLHRGGSALIVKRVWLASGILALSGFVMASGVQAQATPAPADVAKPAKTPPASSADQAARAGMLAQFNDSLQELTSRVSPAIVQIQVTGYRAVGGGKGKR